MVAGHYPKKPGAQYRANDEHSEALIWQQKIIDSLDEGGINTLAVESGKLPKKVKQINNHKPKMDLAIEVHFNSDPLRAGTGSETLYYPGSMAGRQWADQIQRAISPFCSPNRGIKEGWYRMDKPGHIDYKGDVEGDEVVDYFLRKTNCPALILEPYFIHEERRIVANRDIICDVIADAILEKLEEDLV